MKKLLSLIATLGFLAIGITPAQAEADPFPGVAHMAEIPGTRISSPAGYTQSQWEATATYQSFIASGCPAGSGNAISVDVSAKIWSNYCVKTWRSQAVIDAWQDYYDSQRQAQDQAYQRSLAWNTANPGKQKCFQWGPITSPEGGESSGGVCANPVGSSSANSDTLNREADGDNQTTHSTNRVTVEEFTSTQTNQRVSSFMTSLADIPSITSKSMVALPRYKKVVKLGLKVRFTSQTPKVCNVVSTKVRFTGAGTCRIGVRISDGNGNGKKSQIVIARN